jgi:hypothetical protein
MLRVLKSVPLVFVVACAGPQVPAAFAPGSAASPATAAPQRPPVASVLFSKNPLEAPACADEQGRSIPCPAVEGGHDHSGHGQSAEEQGGQAGGHDHDGGHAQPSGGKEPAADAAARPSTEKAHDHSQHQTPEAGKTQDEGAAKANPKPAKPAEHQHHH